MPCAGRHHSLRQHVRKSFTSRRPHNPLWKKYDHESEASGSSYGKEQSGYSTEDSYTKSSGSHTHRAKSDGEQSGGSWDHSDDLNDSDVVGDSEPEEPKDKPATGYGRQYKSGHRLTKHLLHKHFSGKSYNPLSKWGPGYDVSSVRGGGSHTGKSKSVKSYSSHSGTWSTYTKSNSHSDSGSGHSHVKPFHSNKKLFLKHLFSKKGHKAVDIVIETPGKPASPQKNHGSPKGHHVSVFAGGSSRSSHDKGSLHKSFIHKRIFYKGPHQPWRAETDTHHDEDEDATVEYGSGYDAAKDGTAQTGYAAVEDEDIGDDIGGGEFIEVIEIPKTSYGDAAGEETEISIGVDDEMVDVIVYPDTVIEDDAGVQDGLHMEPEHPATATYSAEY